MRKLRIVLGTTVALLLVGGVAAASIPDASGVIHGCRKTSNGDLTVIDSAIQTCPAGTVALNWSQTGPAGPAGPTGPAGPAGVSGYEIVTQHVDLQPNANPQGTSMSAPSGKVVVSSGFYFDNGSGYPTPALAYSYPTSGGLVWTWGFVCNNPVPCPIDKYIVVANVS